LKTIDGLRQGGSGQKEVLVQNSLKPKEQMMSRLQKVFVLSLIVLALVSTSAFAKDNVFTPSAKGYINTVSGGTYNVVPGGTASWGEVNSSEYRGFYDFDTSIMNSLNFPAISKVEFWYGAGPVMVQYPAPTSFTTDLYIGEFMDNGLDAGDWDAGTYAASQTWSSIESTWIDLGQEGINMFYVFGDDYIAFVAPEHFSLSLRNGSNYTDFLASTNRCKLRVTVGTSVRVFETQNSKSIDVEKSTFGSLKALYR
jgi:hypothetical protein